MRKDFRSSKMSKFNDIKVINNSELIKPLDINYQIFVYLIILNVINWVHDKPVAFKINNIFDHRSRRFSTKKVQLNRQFI